MKGIIFLLVCQLALTSNESLIDIRKPKEIIDQDFIISPRRSGTNWTTAILQITTGRPIRFAISPFESSTLGLNRLGLTFDKDKKIFYRTHLPYLHIPTIDQSRNKVLMLLRNYKECLSHEPMELYSSILEHKGLFSDYISILSYFDRWNDEKTKMLVYYEDLITKPKETIEKILIFFEEDASRLDDFMDNFEYWRKRVLDSVKDQNPQKGHTEGKLVVYHTNAFPKMAINQIDKHVKTTYPVLWNKYLYRFETKN